jgi:hypothetical protein
MQQETARYDGNPAQVFRAPLADKKRPGSVFNLKGEVGAFQSVNADMQLLAMAHQYGLAVDCQALKHHHVEIGCKYFSKGMKFRIPTHKFTNSKENTIVKPKT